MITASNPQGRLVTFRVSPPVEDANAGAAALELGRVIRGATGQAIVCADLSAARTFSLATAERFVLFMKSTNLKIERSGLLVGEDSPTLLLQLERMVKEAANPARRTFRCPRQLYGWLALTLSREEASALVDFLGIDPREVT